MRLRHPRALLGISSALIVLLLVYLDLERTSPGALSAVHAAEEELRGAETCARCHAPQGLSAGCTGCHVEIGAQLDGGRGFHGDLPQAQRRACGFCHAEHHGPEHELASARAFELAGYESRESYDHRGLGLTLAGRHSELACADCHRLADAELLAKGERRFLGLDARCETCHADPHEGRMTRTCELCHGERGTFEELTAFAHTRDFPLAGAHAGRACADCHPSGGRWSVEAVAGHDPPPARACADCHGSPHAEQFVARVAALVGASPEASCAECHDAEHESFDAEYGAMRSALHAASGFALEPPHASLDCAACHPRAGSFAERYPGRSADECAACHSDPHAGQFDEGLSSAARCLDCHAPHAFDPPRFGLERHALTAFPLEGRHVDAACRACHLVTEEQAGAARVFRGTPRDCGSCHADAHRGALFDRSAPAELGVAADCGACHLPSGFVELRAGAFDHARWTGFALDGAHARADCEACHARSVEPDETGRRFGRVTELFGARATACSTCHADAHAGRFDLPGLPALVAGSEGCARCHSTERFDDVPRGAFDHARWTGFALEGAHASAACERCHPRTAGPDASGRRFGRVELAFGQPVQECATCHGDPHGGRFDRPDLPTSVAGRAGCARCHDERSFRTAREGFDHGLWTDFALEGAHADARCASCHPAPPGARAPELGPVVGRDCASCHADPHAGQFRERGSSDCARCHASAASFSALAFDHARDARFALDATHAKLACSACHVPWPVAGGGEVVRYKPLGTACADCHGPGGAK